MIEPQPPTIKVQAIVLARRTAILVRWSEPSFI
jgi:hypothetical protein